ncbi:unnamed protein product [Caenorhabditis sp. 36 PRJEB53466]|nr:unnamed protein product [Caenorhabditis sp. 36 PRJEB53466]
MEYVKPIETVGHITKLEDGYAFAKIPDGSSVFIPIQAARLKETLTSMKEKFARIFSYKEEVSLTISPQKGKNDCKYVATRIKKVKKVTESTSDPAPELSAEVHGPIAVRVTSSTDSYAFAESEVFGTIFLPGDAFDKKFVKRVHAYAPLNTILVVKVKEQAETNKCSWVAVEAVKHFGAEREEVDDSNAIETRSFGTVLEVFPTKVVVLDPNLHAIVRCSILTYVGGLRGRSAQTESLADLIKVDERVMYKARYREGTDEYDALEWKHIGETGTIDERKKPTSDSYVQTPPCHTQLILKSILTRLPEELTRFSSMLEHLPDASLPDSYLRERDAFEEMRNSAAQTD